jgi:hypothetical protein
MSLYKLVHVIINMYCTLPLYIKKTKKECSECGRCMQGSRKTRGEEVDEGERVIPVSREVGSTQLEVGRQ